MKKKITIIGLAAAAMAFAPAGPAAASDKGRDDVKPQEVASGLVTPLHLAVGTAKSLYVSQDFAGKLSRVTRGADVEDVYTNPGQGWDVAGVDTRGATTFFLESKGAGLGKPDQLEGYLKAIGPNGKVREVAGFADYERENNPDGDQQYGLDDNVGDACLQQWPKDFPAPARYTGTVDSHPYALAVQGNTAYVADAGMNAILEVDLRSGDVSTLAVLPPRPAVIPAGADKPESEGGLGVPACVVGHEYAFEPVPTDVEIGQDGWLYVTSLPGGPESAALGARGAVFRINPWNGRMKVWADEILSPTGLAIANNGDVYVASLFGGQILKFDGRDGDRSDFLTVNQPADVEIRGNTLYATTDVLPPMTGPEPPVGPPPATGKVIRADLR
ncbi:ScyD/ScyE family protein [Microbacterium sp. NPDC089318]